MGKLWLGALALGVAFGAHAQSQTLYKLIDKNGKVTYSEEAPKNFDGKVIKLDINPDRNTATLPKYEEPAKKPASNAPQLRRETDPAPPPGAKKKKGGASGDDRLDELRERVAKRREALQEARDNPAEGDVQWIGNAGGGTRQVQSESYQRRLAELERALKEAEDDLRNAEGSR
jgi:hypothetical protein